MVSLCFLADFKVQQLDLSKFFVKVVKEPFGNFYHYGSEGMKDKGWGCGYRSLQSLSSWAIKQSSTHMHNTVPSILQIQQTLVEVGDKPSSFINSKDWIGCYEGSIVLDQLFKVSCRLLHVHSGDKVSDICEQLLDHFETVGSPIMVGGDIDAASKTLIGIAKCKENSESLSQWKFLIADPHYIGSDNYQEVVSNNFAISWHDLDVFQPSSFYNFCIPLKL